jgi:hypothetical protein
MSQHICSCWATFMDTAKLYLQLGLRDLLDAVNKLPEF